MTTNFPTGVDSYTAKVDHVDSYRAQHINDLQDAMTAVETTLRSAPNPNPLDYLSKSRTDVVASDKYFQSGVPWHDLRADAKADMFLVADAACTLNSPNLDSATGAFKATDVGKIFDLYSLSAGGITGTQVGTITAYVSPTRVVMSVNANHDASGAIFVYGTDDTAAVQTWINRTGGYHAFSGGGSGADGSTGICMITGTVTVPAAAGGPGVTSRKFFGGTGLFWASARLGSAHVFNLNNMQSGLLRDLHFNASLGALGRFVTWAPASGDTGQLARIEGCDTFSPNDGADWHFFIHGQVVFVERCVFNTNNKIYNKGLWISASGSQCSVKDSFSVGRNYTNCQQMLYDNCTLGPIRAANNSGNDGSGTAQQTNVLNLVSNYMYSSNRAGIEYPNVESVVANANGTDVAGGAMPVVNFFGGYVVFGSGTLLSQSSISGNFTCVQGSTGINVDGTGFVMSGSSPATTVKLVTSTGGAPPVRFRGTTANTLAQVTTAKIFEATAGAGECVVHDYIPSGQAVPWQHPGLASSQIAFATVFASGTATRNALAMSYRMIISPNGAAITRCEISGDGVTFQDVWNNGAIEEGHAPIEIFLAAGAYYRFTWTGPNPTCTLITC